jgi:hypothetical protein
MCMCFCVFLCGLVWLHEVFYGQHVFLVDKFYIRKCKICDMLMLFPNMSISMRQIYIFKTNVIAELIL